MMNFLVIFLEVLTWCIISFLVLRFITFIRKKRFNGKIRLSTFILDISIIFIQVLVVVLKVNLNAPIEEVAFNGILVGTYMAICMHEMEFVNFKNVKETRNGFVSIVEGIYELEDNDYEL